MGIGVRRATDADAAALSELAAATFRETFAGENTAADMDVYVAESFSPARQAAEIADPTGRVLLAEHRDGDAVSLVGYAHVVTGPAPAVVRGTAPVELKRLYVASGWHGQGVAQALMDAALAEACDVGADIVWLGVWERNPRAVAFYGKYGFERIGEHTFVLGTDPQTDWILARPAEEPGAGPG